MGWVIAIIAAFLLFGRNLLSGIVPSGFGGGGGVDLGPVPVVVPSAGGPVTEVTGTTLATPQPISFSTQPILQAGGLAQSGLQSLSSVAQTGSTLAKAIPIVGAAIGAIVGIFAQQSAKRASEARDENSAVAAAVPQWDQWLQQLVSAYNSGQLTDGDMETGFQAMMANYWNIVQPHVQPGRDGCFPGGNFWTTDQAHQWWDSHGGNGCIGNIGAGCCVAYADLWNSIDNLRVAVKNNYNTGKPSPALILGVYPSKYGGISRPPYTVTLARPM